MNVSKKIEEIYPLLQSRLSSCIEYIMNSCDNKIDFIMALDMLSTYIDTDITAAKYDRGVDEFYES